MKLCFWLGAVLLLVFLAVPRLAKAGTIVGSYHDMTYVTERHLDYYGDSPINNYNEVCIYCHTPHNASVAVPLWNRQSEAVSYTPYSSPTLTTNPGQPSPYSLLCLSCHDGTIAIDSVANYNSSRADLVDYHGSMYTGSDYSSHTDCYSCHRGNTLWGNFRNSFLSTDLSNDHPISMPYPASPGYHSPIADKFDNGIRLIDGKVECSPCHNVHDPDIKPFLRASNAGSELCLTCHIK